MPQRAQSQARGKQIQRPATTSEARCEPARDALRRAIVKDLSMQERLLLVLTYAEGMSRTEIAAVLDLAVSQVDVLRERIEGRLSAMLEAA